MVCRIICSCIAFVLVNSPAFAQFTIQVQGENKAGENKPLKDAIVEIHSVPGREVLGSGRTDKDGECQLRKLAIKNSKWIYVIVRPVPTESDFIPHAEELDWADVMKKDKGVIKINLKKTKL